MVMLQPCESVPRCCGLASTEPVAEARELEPAAFPDIRLTHHLLRILSRKSLPSPPLRLKQHPAASSSAALGPRSASLWD